MKLFNRLSLLVAALTASSALASFQGDTVSATFTPSSISPSSGVVSSPSGLTFTLTGGGPGVPSGSIVIPYSATAVFSEALSGPAFGTAAATTLTLQGLAWNGLPGVITNVSVNSGNSLVATPTWGVHSITISTPSQSLLSAGSLTASFTATIAQPLVTLPTFVGRTVGAQYVSGAGTNYFNSISSNPAPTNAVITNSSSPEFSGGSGPGVLGISANLDSNIIDLVFSGPTNGTAQGFSLTFANLVDPDYTITNVALFAGDLGNIPYLGYVYSGNTLTMNFGSALYAGGLRESVFVVSGFHVPEPRTYAGLGILLALGLLTSLRGRVKT